MVAGGKVHTDGRTRGNGVWKGRNRGPQEGGRVREEGVKATEEVRETEEGVRERGGVRAREDTRYTSPALPLPHSHSEHHSANIKVR